MQLQLHLGHWKSPHCHAASRTMAEGRGAKTKKNSNLHRAIMKLNFALTAFGSSATAITCQRLFFLIENDSSPSAGESCGSLLLPGGLCARYISHTAWRNAADFIDMRDNPSLGFFLSLSLTVASLAQLISNFINIWDVVGRLQYKN